MSDVPAATAGGRVPLWAREEPNLTGLERDRPVHAKARAALTTLPGRDFSRSSTGKDKSPGPTVTAPATA
jgi:hypothetical protein